jgi:Kef-type K+ transport system membrane component KefB
MTNSELTIQFFLQIAVILLSCRVVVLIVRRLGQPPVVGEMIAGVLLGPSLLGMLAPHLKEQLFPAGASMSVLYVLAQVGLALYMFTVGLGFDTNLMRHRVRHAASMSGAGICVPLVLGAVVAIPLVHQGDTYFSADLSMWQAMLFLGAGISVTAFPMLARIIVERGLSGTPMGTLALASGATDDALSWALFAIVLASFKHDPMLAVYAIVGGGCYAAFTLTGGKRLLKMLERGQSREARLTPGTFGVVLTILLTASWFTEWIGMYSIFGAFVLGLAVPRETLAPRLKQTLEPVVTSLLLPLFFVYSGLNTQIGLVDSPTLWAVMLGLLAVSILGKGVACYAAARLNRIPQREAIALGSLMNARGLMELILLNLGLQQGVISPTLYSMLVFMAVVTTLMTSPLFHLVYGRYLRQPAPPASLPTRLPTPQPTHQPVPQPPAVLAAAVPEVLS